MIAATRLHTVTEYYFSKKLREVRALVAQGNPIINMGIGSPDLAPPTEVLKAMQDALLEPQAHQYQSYQGIPELREAISNFYATHFNVQVDAANEVLPLMGSKEGIMHVSMAFLNEEDEVLIPNPGYPTYTSVTNLVGATPKYYSLDETTNWFPNLEELEKQDLSNVKLMWLNYPHMPTGANATLVQFTKLVAFAKKYSILLVNDNPYSFILNENPISILQVEGAKEVALELNSLSKTFNMAGWRVGMILGNPQHLQQILKVKSNMDSGMFYGIQKGAIAALHTSSVWFQELNKVYKQRGELIFQLANKLGCSYSKEASGLFVWAKLPSTVTSAEKFIDKILCNQHIFITPGTVFGSQGEGYIRFSLCVSEEKIKEAINRF